MSESTNSIGQSGESRACTHMIEAGYKIREKNWRHRKDEIDLIAENEIFIIFVEVKTRKNNMFGNPEIFVDRKKQSFMIRAANEYMMSKKLEKEVRFDIIGITGLDENCKIEHIPNAFYPLV